MRARLLVVLGVLVVLWACDRGNPVAPASAATEAIDLVPDYVLSPAASIDAAGIGGSLLPDSLRLTPEQKAAIAALHEAFMTATAADVAALREIEREARAARRAGKPRDEIRAILERARPIRERLEAAFRKLRADIWAVYTPEQRAWIEAHRRPSCGPAAVGLTEQQVEEIRKLQQDFYAAVKPDLEQIRSIVAKAREARAAGASREEVRAILATAEAPQRRATEAERRLREAVLALLTPEQRERWLCQHR